jgi:hypothetical protein
MREQDAHEEHTSSSPHRAREQGEVWQARQARGRRTKQDHNLKSEEQHRARQKHERLTAKTTQRGANQIMSQLPIRITLDCRHGPESSMAA